MHKKELWSKVRYDFVLCQTSKDQTVETLYILPRLLLISSLHCCHIRANSIHITFTTTPTFFTTFDKKRTFKVAHLIDQGSEVLPDARPSCCCSRRNGTGRFICDNTKTMGANETEADLKSRRLASFPCNCKRSHGVLEGTGLSYKQLLTIGMGIALIYGVSQKTLAYHTQLPPNFEGNSLEVKTSQTTTVSQV